MSDLSNAEKRNLEKVLQMSGGYVLNFSNRTFGEFVADSTGRDIYGTKYSGGGGSKANILRTFWRVEPNHIVGKILNDLLEYIEESGVSAESRQDLEAFSRTVKRLLQVVPVTDIEVIDPKTLDKDFSTLAKSVRDAIDRDEPESGLDRLHTFITKYLRKICEARGIDVDRDKPLHSLAGEYVKTLKGGSEIESVMTERILKSSISTLDAFNEVRNEKSLAHDNRILNYDESILIFNHVVSTIKFIDSIEKRRLSQVKDEASIDDKIPF